MAKLVSASDTALHEVELQAKDQSEMANAGNHPWSIEGNTESTLLLFNHSTTPQNFDVSIFAGSVTWQRTWKLAPLETAAISLRDLIQNETKDNSGNVLPKSVTSGELNWMDVNPTYGSGRLLQSDRATAMARNFSCGYSGLLCGADYDEFQETLTDGEVIDFAELQPLTCTSGTQNACSGQQTGTGGSFSYSWISETTTVASIANDTGANQTVNLLGVSPGTSTINGHVTSQYCSAGGGGGANVTPTLSLSNALFYNAGIALPSTFTEAASSAVVTAAGADGGSFSWSLSSPSGSIASFSSSSIVSSTTSTGNTVTIYAAGASKALSDLTISLNWTPSGGSAIPATTTTSVDSPYSLSLVTQTPLTGAQTCTPFMSGGNGWYTTYKWEMLSFFGNILLGMNVNEQFTNIVVSQAPGYGYSPNASAGVSGVYTFTDSYCAAFNPDGSITTMPPQNPLLTDVVDSATQTYRLGSTTIGSGTSVQTQTLTRYRDHITVTNIAR